MGGNFLMARFAVENHYEGWNNSESGAPGAKDGCNSRQQAPDACKFDSDD